MPEVAVLADFSVSSRYLAAASSGVNSRLIT
jgi:hypothetical protein